MQKSTRARNGDSAWLAARNDASSKLEIFCAKASSKGGFGSSVWSKLPLGVLDEELSVCERSNARDIEYDWGTSERLPRALSRQMSSHTFQLLEWVRKFALYLKNRLLCFILYSFKRATNYIYHCKEHNFHNPRRNEYHEVAYDDLNPWTIWIIFESPYSAYVRSGNSLIYVYLDRNCAVHKMFVTS